MYTVPCEAIFNQHPRVYRSALVGVGPAGRQRPVIIVEPWPDRRPQSKAEQTALLAELHGLAQAHPHTQPIQDFLIHPAMPVDIRHNAKIFREQLAVWAANRIGGDRQD
jgi:acyl-CoA synthetase (AMP-forming)/AMP-acid ligase II